MQPGIVKLRRDRLLTQLQMRKQTREHGRLPENFARRAVQGQHDKAVPLCHIQIVVGAFGHLDVVASAEGDGVAWLVAKKPVAQAM